MEKKRCDSCIFLNSTRKDGILCSEIGKNKGYPACKNWEPNIENLSDNVKNIIPLLGKCDIDDIPILDWILKKQQSLLEKDINYLFRIGNIVWYFISDLEDDIYQILIQNVTSKYVVGCDLIKGTSFFLPLDTKVYVSKEELLKAREDIAERKLQLQQNNNNTDLEAKVGLIFGKVNHGIIERNVE